MSTSINTINSIDNIIFNNSKIDYLEKLFNSEYTEILLNNVEKIDKKKKEEEKLLENANKEYELHNTSQNINKRIDIIV